MSQRNGARLARLRAHSWRDASNLTRARWTSTRRRGTARQGDVPGPVSASSRSWTRDHAHAD
eukprot:6202980-Pleurochrysis_carterae.AAC.2